MTRRVLSSCRCLAPARPPALSYTPSVLDRYALLYRRPAFGHSSGIWQARSISATPVQMIRSSHPSKSSAGKDDDKSTVSYHLKKQVDRARDTVSSTKEELQMKVLEQSQSLADKAKRGVESGLVKLKENVSWVCVEILKNPLIIATWAKNGWQVLRDFGSHMYHGSKLLYTETKLAWKLFRKMTKGHRLTRRERMMFTKTTSDVFRLIPFSFFIIIPFMELALPIALKIFPNMIPSQFQDQLQKSEQVKKQLKLRLEMAKYLQSVVLEMASSLPPSANPNELVEFLHRLREGQVVSSQEILKFSQVFRDYFDLDQLSKRHLEAMCRYIGLSPYGSDVVLRMRLRHAMAQIQRDDREIYWEGVENLKESELEVALRARGMRPYGLSEEAMRKQLEGWLTLSQNRKVPMTLLFLSRAFIITAKGETTDALREALKEIPDDVVVEAVSPKEKPAEPEKSNKEKLQEIQDEALIMEAEAKREEEAQQAKKAASKLMAGVTHDKDAAVMATVVASAKTQDGEPYLETREQLLGAMESLKEEVEHRNKRLRELATAIAVLSSTSPVEAEKQELDALKASCIDLKTSLPDLMQHSGQVRKFESLLSKIENEIDVAGAAIFKEVGEVDSDRDGVMPVEDVRKAFAYLKNTPSDDVIDEVIAELDKDGDGMVTVADVKRVSSSTNKSLDFELDEWHQCLLAARGMTSHIPGSGRTHEQPPGGDTPS